MSDHESLPPPPSVGAVQERCYRHPAEITGVHCTRCGRPICPACMIPAPVGHQCPECVGQARKEFAKGPGRRMAVGAAKRKVASLTNVLLGTLAAVYLVEVAVAGPGGLVSGPSTRDLVRLGAMVGVADLGPKIGLVGVALGQYWRLFTAMFLHAGIFHLAMNAYALWIFGKILEEEIGRGRMLAIYLVTGLCASAASYAFMPAAGVVGGIPIFPPGVGASGAIFGLFGAFVAYNYRRREMRFYRARLMSLLPIVVINVVLSLSIPNIDWRAHVGGLIAGFLAGYAAEGVGGDRATKRASSIVGFALLLVAAVALVAWRTNAIHTLYPQVASAAGS